MIELIYQTQLTPWLQAQPVMKFVLNRGGGDSVVNPDDVSEPLHNEAAFGMP